MLGLINHCCFTVIDVSRIKECQRTVRQDLVASHIPGRRHSREVVGSLCRRGGHMRGSHTRTTTTGPLALTSAISPPYASV
eukprot:scaffold127927_cov36-Prasinocladus_malaysianus.AAC.1